MTRPLVVGIAAGAAALVCTSLVFARQNQPGMPTLAQVLVINRDRNDAIPVTVAGEPTVAISPASIVSGRAAAQVWEYRRIIVPVANDATPILNGAGAEGWEAIDSAVAGPNAVWTMKRPR